jgi:hypothetical protein
MVMLLAQPHRHIFENLRGNPEWKLALQTPERFLFVRVSDL